MKWEAIMMMAKINKAYETFKDTHRARRAAEEEKNKYASGCAQRALMERQVKIFDDLERAQFEYLKLVLDEFWNYMKEIYDRWGGNAEEEPQPLNKRLGAPLEEGGPWRNVSMCDSAARDEGGSVNER